MWRGGGGGLSRERLIGTRDYNGMYKKIEFVILVLHVSS